MRLNLSQRTLYMGLGEKGGCQTACVKFFLLLVEVKCQTISQFSLRAESLNKMS